MSEPPPSKPPAPPAGLLHAELGRAQSGSVIELRQYLMKPGHFDAMATFFESTLVAPQERAGIAVIGVFRDLDEEDNFVWVRSFQDMPDRARALAEFYDGPIWRAFRDEANSHIEDSGNVLLLSPARPNSDFDLDSEGTDATRKGATNAVLVSIQPVDDDAGEGQLLADFESLFAPSITRSGGRILGYFTTNESPNNFPRLPVVEDKQVFVSFAGFPELTDMDGFLSDRRSGVAGRSVVPGERSSGTFLRLLPTTRSRLRRMSTR